MNTSLLSSLALALACPGFLYAEAPQSLGQDAALVEMLERTGPEAPSDLVEKDRLRAMLASLPHRRAINGSDEEFAALLKTADLLRDHLKGLGYEVHEQEVRWSLPMRPRTDGGQDANARGVLRVSPNLWVDLPGTTRPEEVVIIGAHYDVVPGTPGADDNGSGTAAVMELARVLRDFPTERTIRLQFYTAEEVGLVGAFAYAEEIARPAIESGEETIVGMVSLDMIGYFSDEPGSQRYPAQLPEFLRMRDSADFIAAVAIAPHASFHVPFMQAMAESEPDLPQLSTGMLPVAIPDMRRSDHAAFWDLGVPAIQITDTSEFRYRHYHKPTDTIDQLDFDRLTQVVRALADATRHAAGPIEAPDGRAEPASLQEASP